MRKLLVIVSIFVVTGAAIAVPQTRGLMSPAARVGPTFPLATLDQNVMYYFSDTSTYVSGVRWQEPDTFLLAIKFHPYDFQDPLGYLFGYPLWILELRAVFYQFDDPSFVWDSDKIKFIIFGNDGKTVLHTSAQMAALKNTPTEQPGATFYTLPDSVRINSGDFWVAVQRVNTKGFPTLCYAPDNWRGHSYIRNRLWVLLNSPSIGLDNAGEWLIVALVNYTPSATGEKTTPTNPLALNFSASPVRSRVEISYTLPKAGFASLVVYDPTGRTVAQLADGDQAAGTHHLVWNGTDRSGAKVPGGAYLCRLSAAGASVVKKVLLVQ